MEKKSLKSRISDIANLPKDVTLGLSSLTIYGNEKICVENINGILEYKTERIRLQTLYGKIKIEGANLKIEAFTCSEIVIYGEILSIEFMTGGSA